MPAHSELTALAIVVLAALICGMVMTRLRQPAVVGYILAGVILGPTLFPDPQHREQIGFLAELGVLMLLFFIGMELSLRGFRAVWKIGVAATLLQLAISLVIMLAASWLFGLPPGVAVLFAFVIALSSTAVVVKMLEQMNILRGPVGQLTLGVLIAQDLAVVPMMLTIVAFGEGGFGLAAAVKIAVAIAVLAWLIWYLSRLHRITLPFATVVAGNLDLTPLSGLVYCFGAAALTGLIGLSPAFGAFLAGLVIGNSTGRAAMIRSTRPIQSVLLMLFFLSIGLLIDLPFIWQHLATVALMLLFVTVLKTFFNIGILHFLREPWPHAFIAGVLLAQIGEFSFILGSTGVASGVITPTQNSLIVAVAAFSLLFSPLWQIMVRRLLRVAVVSFASLKDTVGVAAGAQGTRAYMMLRNALRAAGQGARGAGASVAALGRRAAKAPQPTPAGEAAADPPEETPAAGEGAVVIDHPAKSEPKRRASGGA